MNASVRAYVGVGANVGDAKAAVLQAFDRLDALPTTRLAARSRLYRTPPWGPVAQDDFVNAVAALDTHLAPVDLLDALLDIERDAGRDRANAPRWGPRRLDLDLLLYGDAAIDLPGLHVPHPRMHERAFVIVPLAEIAPGLHIPGQGDVGVLLGSIDRAGVEALDGDDV